jgi:mannosyltransferase
LCPLSRPAAAVGSSAAPHHPNPQRHVRPTHDETLSPSDPLGGPCRVGSCQNRCVSTAEPLPSTEPSGATLGSRSVLAHLTTRRVAYAVGAITLLAAIVRFPTLAVQSYWLDEGTTVTSLALPFGRMLSHSMDVEAYPPLYFVLAWPWSKMFGLSEFGLRSLSAVLGTATVPVAYAAARRLFSVRVGLFAALLVACSPLLVWYSQEARPYELLVFLSTLSLFWFVRVLDDACPADFIGWSVVSMLALLTHYFALFPVGFEAAWLLVAFRRRKHALVAVACVACAGLALLPLIASQRSHTGPSGWTVDRAHRILGIPKVFLFGAPGNRIDSVLVIGVALAVIAAGGWGLAVLCKGVCRARARVPLGVGLAALIPPVALALVGVDYLEPRGPMASFIPLLIALAAGLSVLPRAGLALTATLAALWLGVIVAFNVDGSLQREDYRAAARIVAAIPGRVALSLTPFGGDGALKHYLPSLRHYPSQGDKVSSVLLLDVNRPPSRRSPPIPPGFTIFSRKTAGSYTLIRLQPTHATYVSPALLAEMRLGPGFPVLLLASKRR